ncbi:hypothetical protein AcW1_003827 [Taiwanofungus camphoratus]|nr:hypothetical protein AcW1_003827 [Antrodia cinnamomea]
MWADLESYETEMHRQQESGQDLIVLIRTGWSRFWGSQTYLDHPYLDREVAEKIIDAGVKTIGIDTLSPDATSEHGDFAVHKVILGAGGAIAENLTDLDKIAEGKWMVNLVPLKIGGSDGSPVRAFAWRQSKP